MWPRLALIGTAVAGFLLLLVRAKRLGQEQERAASTSRANEVRRDQLEAAARRPTGRDELADRLRNGRF